MGAEVPLADPARPGVGPAAGGLLDGLARFGAAWLRSLQVAPAAYRRGDSHLRPGDDASRLGAAGPLILIPPEDRGPALSRSPGPPRELRSSRRRPEWRAAGRAGRPRAAWRRAGHLSSVGE